MLTSFSLLALAGHFLLSAASAAAPTITCPADLNLNTDLGQCTASDVNLGAPTVTGNGVVISNNAPQLFPVGTTTVLWTARDAQNNTATCQQRVLVTDNQLPHIVCPPDIATNTDPGQCSANSIVLGTPVVSDNCAIASVYNDGPGSFLMGVTPVFWTVVDINGNSETCVQLVSIVNHFPVALDDGAIAQPNQPLSIPFSQLLANDSDPDHDPLTVIASSSSSAQGGNVRLANASIVYTPPPGYTGLDHFTYTVSDPCDNHASAQIEVSVIDGAVPAQNSMNIVPSFDGYLLRFRGSGGHSYEFSRATNVTGPWIVLNSATAPLSGVIEYEDDDPPPSSAFYRMTEAH